MNRSGLGTAKFSALPNIPFHCQSDQKPEERFAVVDERGLSAISPAPLLEGEAERLVLLRRCCP